MLDHLALQCASPERSSGFDRTVFAALGVAEVMRVERPEGTVVGLGGPDGFPRLWLGPVVDEGRRPVHVALTAPSREAVEAVHDAAVEEGVTVLHEPQVWAEYHPGYYAVFLRDPDDNNVEAVHHRW